MNIVVDSEFIDKLFGQYIAILKKNKLAKKLYNS